jgi:signal transduction histidine kinase
MTAAVNDVIRRRDFSKRVTKSTTDEVGTLVDAFNTMLGEVGERANALEESNRRLQHEVLERENAERAVRQLNQTLEQRIAERSAELERAHEKLRQSQKLEAIGQLTGGVAHDFNNVLQVISGNLQMLQMTAGQDAAVRQRVETAIFAADRGAKLSSQLLAFARRQPLQPVSTHIGKVLRGMDDLLRRALGESIDIETVVAGGLWTTLVDPHQLENVILNLALNARDAMNGSGRLTLELGNAMLSDDYVANVPDLHPGQYVVLAISDTGCGMPAEIIARVFEPFFTTKPEGQGTGLGLSMAYGFVKQSDGHIQIYSEPGNGTTIKVYLPRSL